MDNGDRRLALLIRGFLAFTIIIAATLLGIRKVISAGEVTAVIGIAGTMIATGGLPALQRKNGKNGSGSEGG